MKGKKRKVVERYKKNPFKQQHLSTALFLLLAFSCRKRKITSEEGQPKQ